MCARRMLRSGPWSEAVIRSGNIPRPDEPRQPSLDLDAAPNANRPNTEAVAEQAQEFARKLEYLAGVHLVSGS